MAGNRYLEGIKRLLSAETYLRSRQRDRDNRDKEREEERPIGEDKSKR